MSLMFGKLRARAEQSWRSGPQAGLDAAMTPLPPSVPSSTALKSICSAWVSRPGVMKSAP